MPLPMCPNPMNPTFMNLSSRLTPGALSLHRSGRARRRLRIRYLTDDDLDDGIGELAAHEAIADESDSDEFTHHHRVSELQRDAEIRDQEGKGMEHAAEAGRDASDRAATQRATAAGDTSIVGQRFGETHADGRAKRRCKPDKESTQGLAGQARRCEDRRQCRDRTIHQPQETRLNLLEHHWHCHDDPPALNVPESLGAYHNAEN